MPKLLWKQRTATWGRCMLAFLRSLIACARVYLAEPSDMDTIGDCDLRVRHGSLIVYKVRLVACLLVVHPL